MGSWKALKIKKKEKGTALTSLKPPFRTRHNNELESMKSTQLRSNEQRQIFSAIFCSFWIEITLWGAHQYALGLCIGGIGEAILGVGFTFVRFHLEYAVRSQSGSNEMQSDMWLFFWEEWRVTCFRSLDDIFRAQSWKIVETFLQVKVPTFQKLSLSSFFPLPNHSKKAIFDARRKERV